MKSWFNAVATISILVQLANAALIPARGGAVCSMVQRKIFCYGGYDVSNNILSDTWSLDASNNFTLATPNWNNITPSNNFVTTPAGYAVSVALNDGVSFLVNGGMSTPRNVSETNQTIVLNTVTNAWTAINSTQNVQTRQHQAVVDSTGKIWLWGGVSDYQTGHANQSYWGAFTTLNPANWAWTGLGGSTSGPNARVGHTMTITPTGTVYIIGGLIATKLGTLDSQGYSQWTLTDASMSDVPNYNTANGQWNLVTASGAIPQARNIHSATLAADGVTIIIFGGATGNTSSVFGDLNLYNVNSNSWTALNLQNGPSSRAGHCAVQINTTMFVMLGFDFTFTPLADIHALDTVNWRWVTEYSANGYPLLSTGTNSTNGTDNSGSGSGKSSGLSSGAIAGIAVGVVVVVAGAGVLLFFFLRRKKKEEPVQAEAATANYGQQPPMQERPLPPQHQNSSQPYENIFNNGSQSDGKGSYYGGQNSSQQQHTSFINSQGFAAGSETTEATPPYTLATRSPNAYDTSFTSKPDAQDVPHFTLQPSKPNEDD